MIANTFPAARRALIASTLVSATALVLLTAHAQKTRMAKMPAPAS